MPRSLQLQLQQERVLPREAKSLQQEHGEKSVNVSYAGNLVNFAENWRQITSDPWILQCVEGYHLEFESEPCQPVLPSQANFSKGQRQATDKEVLKLLEKGAIVKAQNWPGEFISNLFLVPKKTCDLNKFVAKRHFKMETISVARELINSNDYLASVDLSNAYFSIPIHESYRKFLRFIWKEQLYEFVCLPFGCSLAPRTFTKVLKPLYSLLGSNGMKVCYYIDDSLIIAASKAECSANVHKVIRLLGDLGFKTNFKKSQVDPVT